MGVEDGVQLFALLFSAADEMGADHQAVGAGSQVGGHADDDLGRGVDDEIVFNGCQLLVFIDEENARVAVFFRHFNVFAFQAEVIVGKHMMVVQSGSQVYHEADMGIVIFDSFLLDAYPFEQLAEGECRGGAGALSGRKKLQEKARYL